MTLKRSLFGSSALLILASGMAVADVSASDVWADWQSIMTSYGEDVSLGTTSQNGDVFTIKGAQIDGVLDGGSYTITAPDIMMTDMDDGTVSIVIGDVSKVTAVFPTETGRDGQVITTVTTTDYKMTASGTPQELVYDYAIEGVRVSANEMTMGNITMAFVAEMMMKGVTGKSIVTPGELRKVTQSFVAEDVSANIEIDDPSGLGGGKVTFDMSGINSTTTANMPDGINIMDTQALKGTGYAVDASFAYSALDFDLDVVDEERRVAIASANKGGSTSVFGDDVSVAAAFQSQDVKVDISSGQFPFPIALSAAKQASTFKMPVAPTDDAQDFSLAYELGDFEMSEMLWGLFDPAAQLPRDPATLAFDIEGTGKLAIDLTDPDIAETAMDMDGPVGELISLNLNALLLDMVGAKIEGTGAFTFDNTDLTAFDGMPKPTGQIDLSMFGIDGLMDTLSKVGLLPAEQAMGARMMMGLFTRPGDGPDSLTSKIEINEAGQVLANGQRIR